MEHEKPPTNDELNEALIHLMELGLVESGVNEEGEIVFWATEKGHKHAKGM